MAWQFPHLRYFHCLFLQSVFLREQSRKPGPEPGPVLRIWSPAICQAESTSKEPVPQRFHALKIYSKAASETPVFIINMTSFIRVHFAFCFLFLALPFHCFPKLFFGNVTETQTRRPQHLPSLFSPAAIFFHQSLLFERSVFKFHLYLIPDKHKQQSQLPKAITF